jgi:hypothetical protein
LAGWLAAEATDLKDSDALEQAVRAWEQNARHEDWLLEGTRLAYAEALAAKPRFRERLNTAREFLLASRRRADRRVEALAAAERRAKDDRNEPRTFLCHSSGDKAQVRDLHNRLKSDGIRCWFVEDDLVPGQDWDLEITKAIEDSKYVLACLSKSSIDKRGYVQKELRKALDVALEQPEGGVFLIPVRLEDCDVPESLQRWHWVDLFTEGAYQSLLRALRREI